MQTIYALSCDLWKMLHFTVCSKVVEIKVYSKKALMFFVHCAEKSAMFSFVYTVSVETNE